MPKVRRIQSPSTDRTRSSPYPSSPRNVELLKPKNLLGSVEDLKEWEEARCPICMEPPHNAVLLKCSSYEMGCRPYMCNTSYRHSNCLDQFCMSYANLSSAILQEIPLTGMSSFGNEQVQQEPGHPAQCRSQLQPKLVCPLCRGEISGYMVLKPARKYMNSKPRSCSSETCEFHGTYSELRKHARSEHPSVRPSEVNPSRLHDWTRMEQERDLEDFFSSIQASSGLEYSGDSIFTGDLGDVLSLFLMGIFYSVEEAGRMTSWLAESRHRMPQNDRRSGMMFRVSEDMETNQPARWRGNLFSMQEPETYGTGRWRSNLSSFHDLEANRTARWRTSLSLSRMPSNLYQYYGEASHGGISSTRMPHAEQQITETVPWRNISSSGRIAGRQQLRWRDQRWSTYYNP